MKLKLHKGLHNIFFKISLYVLISNTVIAQSFERNNWYFDTGFGFGTYNINLQVKEDVSEWKSRTVTLPFRIEYALLNQIGIGFIFSRNLHSLNNSGITSIKTSNSNSLLFKNSVHISEKLVDFSISIQYGLGYLEQNFKYLNINRVLKGVGINYGVDFLLRLYPDANDKMAFIFGTTFNNYSFDLLTYAENNEQFNLKNQNRFVTILGSDIFLGITYHPLKQK
jgi:hypothetical protein